MGAMTAAERWRTGLEAWALPQRLLDAVPDSPYTWPVHLWRRMQGSATAWDTATTSITSGLLDDHGTLLDVGAGTGRASLWAPAAGHPLTAVEPSREMAEGLRAEAAAAGVEVRVIEQGWPEAADAAGRHDVVLCANVVYGVADLAPFLEALHRSARSGVVLEVPPRHPRSHLGPYFGALHGIDRPEGPTVDTFLEVVAETLGLEPEVERWQRATVMRFADLQELLDLYRRRLLLPVERTAELADVLAPDIVERDGWLTLGPVERPSCTVWWRTSPP
jgi:SAM-dependent methyltransferase